MPVPTHTTRPTARGGNGSIRAELDFGVAGQLRLTLPGSARSEAEAADVVRRLMESRRGEWDALCAGFVRAVRDVWPEARLTVVATMGGETVPLVHEAPNG